MPAPAAVATLPLAPPRPLSGTVPRTREYLTAAEIEALTKAARARGRHGHRDATLILLGYRHGLRAGELTALRWDQVDLGAALLHVRRLKRGTPSVHPLGGSELRALRRLSRENPPSPYLFCSERGGPLTPSALRKLFARLGPAAGLPFPVHPHMLRHACGYALARKGYDTRAIQAYLGHRQIQHTVRYTALDDARFRGWWGD